MCFLLGVYPHLFWGLLDGCCGHVNFTLHYYLESNFNMDTVELRAKSNRGRLLLSATAGLLVILSILFTPSMIWSPPWAIDGIYRSDENENYFIKIDGNKFIQNVIDDNTVNSYTRTIQLIDIESNKWMVKETDNETLLNFESNSLIIHHDGNGVTKMDKVHNFIDIVFIALGRYCIAPIINICRVRGRNQ